MFGACCDCSKVFKYTGFVGRNENIYTFRNSNIFRTSRIFKKPVAMCKTCTLDIITNISKLEMYMLIPYQIANAY